MLPQSRPPFLEGGSNTFDKVFSPESVSFPLYMNLLEILEVLSYAS